MGKKIGIVTWYGGSNYGTSLQAFALYYKIKQLGATPYLLKKYLTWRNVVGKFLRSVTRSTQIPALYGLSQAKKHKIKCFRKRNFNQFILCFGFIGKVLYSRQIRSLNSIISGSDQLWNPYYTEPYLLLEGLKIKKFSYASSIGVTQIPKDKQILYRRALPEFSAISVRESSAIPILKEFYSREIFKVVDPTFLLAKNDWEKFADETSQLDRNRFTNRYILCYFIAENDFYWDQVQELQRREIITRVIVLPMKSSHFRKQYEMIEDAGINDFVYLIKQSALVCTDSFHATAISINLEKNFFVFPRFKKTELGSQNSRLIDLLSRYGLQDRFLRVIPENFPQKINYPKVQGLLEMDRFESISYLNRIIEES